MHSMSEFSDDERIAEIYDPWEEFNRSIYKFSYYFDKNVFLPVVSGYEFITPTFVQTWVSNFFGNIGEVRLWTETSPSPDNSKRITKGIMDGRTIGCGSNIWGTYLYIGTEGNSAIMKSVPDLTIILQS